MKLIFERGAQGRRCDLVPPCTPLPDLGGFARSPAPPAAGQRNRAQPPLRRLPGAPAA